MGSTYKSYLRKLDVLHKRIIRIIAGVNRREHTKPLFNNLRILTLSDLFSYNIGLLMYKYHHGWLPSVLDMFSKNSDVHNYGTRQANYLKIPQFFTDLGQMSFRYQAVKIWNNIYKFLKVDIKIGTFKKHLKSYLIKQ